MLFKFSKFPNWLKRYDFCKAKWDIVPL